MAKKQPERSEVEHLRAENKRLVSENKHLKKQIARSNKRSHQYQDLEEKVKDIELEKVTAHITQAVKCPNCQGKLKETSIGIRLLISCESCNYHETRKNNG